MDNIIVVSDEDDLKDDNGTTFSPENASLKGPPSPRYEVLSGSLVDAIASLAPRQYLSSTAVDLLVRAIPAGDDIRIYNPSFLYVDQPRLIQKQSDGTWPTTLGIIPTLHQHNHWTWIVIDPVEARADFYNFLPK